jgi:hypothetical protein
MMQEIGNEAHSTVIALATVPSDRVCASRFLLLASISTGVCL